MALTPAEIRRQILKRQNLHPKVGGGLTNRMPYSPDKTTLMRFVEERYRAPIESLLWDGSLDEVSNKLDVDRTTVLRWRRKLAS